MPERSEIVLTPVELARYSRHLALPEVGRKGQEKLKASAVLLVGAGGLGSPVGLYLAAAGVGRIGLADFDRVDLSNLQRQVLYRTRDVGRSKVDAARQRLADLNPAIEVIPHEMTLSAENALAMIAGYDLVVDGSDNFATRYIVNDACVLRRKPNVYGSVFRFEGQVAVFWARRGPCYRCLFPEPPPIDQAPSCAEAGILGVLPATIGALQATEALKILLDCGTPLVGRLLHFDALEPRFHTFAVPRDPACPVCGSDPWITSALQIGCLATERDPRTAGNDIEAAELRARLAAGQPPLLLDLRPESEWQVARLPGARHLALVDLEARCGKLDPEAETVVYCQRGVNSVTAAGFLRRAGFRRVRSLRGGLAAWLRESGPLEPE